VRRGAVAALAIVGCTAPLEAMEGEAVVQVGEHVELRIDPGLEPCGDLVGHMDAFTAAVADALAVDLEGLRFTYHWETLDGFVAGPCSDGALGCAAGDEIHALVAPLDHELVHSVSFQIGRPASFFVEGLAVAFQTEIELADGTFQLPGDAAVADAIASTQYGPLAAGHYPLAGAFTAFLLDRHGMAAYREFYDELRPGTDMATIAEAFAGSFGEPLADAIARFDAERRACPAGVSRHKLLECGGPALAWDEGRLEVRRSLRCEDGAVGPFFDGTARAWATFEVAEAGGFAVTFASEAWRSTVALTSCGGCDGDWVAEVFAASDGPREVFLPAGRYALQFAGPPGEQTAMALRLQRLE
jgi:hypothetical protein